METGVVVLRAHAVTRSDVIRLARDLGRYRIRVNAICSGPVATMAAKGIPGFREFEDIWGDRAPLGWDMKDASSVGKTACALLSDYMPMTTGELIHVDGGYHAMGAELPPEPEPAT